jgi:hypothetical protein
LILLKTGSHTFKTESNSTVKPVNNSAVSKKQNHGSTQSVNKKVVGLGPQLSKVLTSSSPDLNAANLLINAKADVNGISSVNFKDTYLGFACFEGRFGVVKFLL